MSQNPPPDTPTDTTPLPPMVKAIALGFSTFMTLALLAFIGFIAVEFTADMVGHPLFVTQPAPTEEELSPIGQDTDEELKSPFELITPKHQTLMRGPEVVVIYTVREGVTNLPELKVNGVQHHWTTQFGNNTWFALLHLPVGQHHLRAGEAEADFFVSTSDVAAHLTETWRRHAPHPGTNDVDRCIDCHEMPPSRWRALGAWRGTASCFGCHDEQKHAVAHRFVQSAQPLRCVRCHMH